MAKKREEEKLNYKSELRALKTRGPELPCVLWGPED